MLRSFGSLLLVLLFSTDAAGQFLFEPQTYRDWTDASNGSPCETEFQGTYSSQLEYPASALETLTPGEALVVFDTVYAEGALTIENPRVVASTPTGVFDETALAVARRFQFPTEMRNCTAVRARVVFRIYDGAEGGPTGIVAASLAEPPLRPDTVRALRDGNVRTHCQIETGAMNLNEFGEALARLYPLRALDREREGWAVVQFTIAQDGSVVAPVALEEPSGGWGFGVAAVQAIAVARFPPRAAACENAATTVRFVIAD